MKIKKFLPYILILAIMFGFMGLAGKVSAAGCSITPITDPSACITAGGVWTDSDGLGGAIAKISGLLNALIPLMIALGVVYFVWGVVQYVIGNDEEAKTKGRNHIIFGLIGFAVILGLWGLVYILTDTFNLDGGGAPTRDELNDLLPS